MRTHQVLGVLANSGPSVQWPRKDVLQNRQGDDGPAPLCDGTSAQGSVLSGKNRGTKTEVRREKAVLSPGPASPSADHPVSETASAVTQASAVDLQRQREAGTQHGALTAQKRERWGLDTGLGVQETQTLPRVHTRRLTTGSPEAKPQLSGTGT